jgi:hypothetical protein
MRPEEGKWIEGKKEGMSELKAICRREEGRERTSRLNVARLMMYVGSTWEMMMAGRTVTMKMAKTRYWRSCAEFPRLRNVSEVIRAMDMLQNEAERKISSAPKKNLYREWRALTG